MSTDMMLVCLQPKMVYELTAVMLNQIVSGRKSVLDAYGEIVFKAWRAATGGCLERIETHLIQNVGLHPPPPPSPSPTQPPPLSCCCPMLHQTQHAVSLCLPML